MNNLYHWHNEVMVNLEMEELRREMDAIHLLRDAEFSNPGLFERALGTIGTVLAKLGYRVRKHDTAPHQAYQVTTSKYAM